MWHRSIYASFFLTLTSSPDSTPDALRLHFQYLRHRIAKHLGIPRTALEYICVSTREGHGVIHSVIAVPAGCLTRRGFLLEFALLQSWWTEIHGAFMVNVKAIRRLASDRRKVAGYIVAQYLADQQGAYLRLSQSRSSVNWRQQRDDFREFSWPDRWHIVTRRNRMTKCLEPDLAEIRIRAWKKWAWRKWREALRRLLADGYTGLWGRVWRVNPETGRVGWLSAEELRTGATLPEWTEIPPYWTPDPLDLAAAGKGRGKR